MTDVVNFFAYILLFAAAGFFWSIEHKDIRCPSFSSSEKECEEGGGMAFSHTKPLPTDSCDVLLKKLYKAAGAEQTSVKWRRAFVLAVAVMTIMWFLVGSPGALPDWKVMYLSVLIGYTILLGSYMYYSYHVFGVAETWMKQTIEILRQRCIQ